MIFITENDVLRGNQPLYIIERQIVNTGKPFDDGEHIIYVNGADQNSTTELGKLMHDFFCIDPDDMHFKELADKARFFKQDEKGVAAMCKVLEDMRNETTWQTKADIVLRLLEMDMSLEQVNEIAGQKSA